MIKVSRIILLIIFLSGCASTKMILEKDILGKYYWKSIYGVSADITLYSDRTFEYNWVQGLSFGTSHGGWRLNKKNLILNSNRQPNKELASKMKKLLPIDTSQYEIKVVDIGGNYLPFAICYLTRDTLIVSDTTADEFGQCKLPRSIQADFIKINWLGEEVSIPIKKLKMTSFIVEMKTNKHYEFFTNRKWKIRGDRIYDPKIIPDRFTKRYYEKEKE